MTAIIYISYFVNAFLAGALVIILTSSNNRRVLAWWLWNSAQEMDEMMSARLGIRRSRFEKENEQRKTLQMVRGGK